ncbi:hypothetical protein NM208_g249 [Fusarium decemcellulare]|uniref:Uncharacterized protein n=1 Tax=Fusarium decemcellulare TaxID=57161 RepID=A0ACC1T0F2_9HYPO|nr:hypothetical protein NM208_g249 [Fusarium decemcellulare]
MSLPIFVRGVNPPPRTGQKISHSNEWMKLPLARSQPLDPEHVELAQGIQYLTQIRHPEPTTKSSRQGGGVAHRQTPRRPHLVSNGQIIISPSACERPPAQYEHGPLHYEAACSCRCPLPARDLTHTKFSLPA